MNENSLGDLDKLPTDVFMTCVLPGVDLVTFAQVSQHARALCFEQAKHVVLNAHARIPHRSLMTQGMRPLQPPDYDALQAAHRFIERVTDPTVLWLCALHAWARRETAAGSTGADNAVGKMHQAKKRRDARLELANLQTCPPGLGWLKDVRTLCLDGNQFKHVSSEIEELAKLEILSLENNELTSLPPWVGNLTALSTFYACRNNLVAIPPALGKLHQLKTFGISHNRIDELPDIFSGWHRLDVLSASHNLLRDLPTSICDCRSLRRLTLANNRLSTLPDEVGNLTALEMLNVSDNQLACLPNSLGQLRRLDELVAAGNALTMLPLTGSNARLKYLDLSRNRFTSLPIELASLQNLSTVCLSDNQIAELGAGLGQRFRASLGLRNNQIAALPRTLAADDCIVELRENPCFTPEVASLFNGNVPRFKELRKRVPMALPPADRARVFSRRPKRRRV